MSLLGISHLFDIIQTQEQKKKNSLKGSFKRGLKPELVVHRDFLHKYQLLLIKTHTLFNVSIYQQYNIYGWNKEKQKWSTLT